MSTRRLAPLAVIAASATLAAAPGALAAPSSAARQAAPAASSAPGPLQTLQNAYVSVVKKVAPTVVQIETGDGLGSGIVYDRQGHIVTNAHVVGTATQF